MEERTITIEYDATAEDAYRITLRLLNEFGAKYEDDGEGNITYQVPIKYINCPSYPIKYINCPSYSVIDSRLVT